MTPGPNDDIAARILASIASLPLAEQAAAIASLVNAALQQMPNETIREIRAEIMDQFRDQLHIPVVRDTLDLIDGCLALRQIADLPDDPPASDHG
jgi:hypothetical protein